MSNDFQNKKYFSRANTKTSTVSKNQIFKLVCEMVEITTKRLSEEKSQSSDLAVQKFDTLKSDSEKEPPVRRSNRIRRTVVKKDEIVTLRPNKKVNNKSLKNAESPDLKIPEKVLINTSDLKKVNESCNKEISKNKSVSKPSKSDKSDKVTKNSSLTLQNERKKASRKGKTKKNENLNTEDRTNSSLDLGCKVNENPQTQELSLSSSCSNALNDVSKTETKSSDVQSNTQKFNDDQNSEMSDKLVESCNKPVKVKSRWWRSSELEAVMNSESVNQESTVTKSLLKSKDIVPVSTDSIKTPDPISEENKKNSDDDFPSYEHITENIYRFNRKKCKSKKQVRRMVCDCTLTKEELENGMLGCKEECLNRLLMIECGSRCPIGEACSNKKFQKKQYVKAELIKTEKKGWGLRTLEDILAGDFVLEFVGEVLNHKEYRQRVKQYAKEKNVHSYFMALKTDEILDATNKGNFSRFMNHSCNPNCETQKWTVNGELRVGVFAKRMICSGEELTLDYQFQRYGREAQKCYCGSDICSGFIGSAKQISIDAYSGNKQQMVSRKRKGPEDKKRDMEDMIFEEELEKLSGSRGLRNRDDTLKLARLMVRADDPDTRHQLLNIILKTDQPACLRLFLDYHGLPLLWSWMTDVMELDLKEKILQVLSLLPITNKTMLLDSRVMSIVEKWQSECSSNHAELKDSKSVTNTEYAVDSKKLKVTDLSDSETDSTSSHTISDSCGDAKMNTDEGSLLEAPKVESLDPGSGIKMNITDIATGLLNNWNNLKEVFRIPRLEQQKRKEDELEVDNRAKEQDKVRQQQQQQTSAYNEVSFKCGDQIQVVISGKNTIRDRSYDYEPPGTKMDGGPRRFNQSRTLPIVSKTRHPPVTKAIRAHHLSYPPLADSDESKHIRKEEEGLPSSVCIPDMSPHQMPHPNVCIPDMSPHQMPPPNVCIPDMSSHQMPPPNVCVPDMSPHQMPPPNVCIPDMSTHQMPPPNMCVHDRPSHQMPPPNVCVPDRSPHQMPPPNVCVPDRSPHQMPPPNMCVPDRSPHQMPPPNVCIQDRSPHQMPPPNVCLPDMSPRQIPPDSFPPPVYSEHSFTPSSVESAPSPVVYPPQIMFPPTQMPFMGSPPSMLPHNPAVMPPPTSVASQQPHPHMQQPPHQTGQIPIRQPGPMGAPPPCSNNFLLPQNAPPSPVVPSSQVQQPPMQGYPPAVYSNQGQQQQQQPPLYFIPQQQQQQVNNPPPTSFPENIPIQQSSSTFPVQTLIPVVKEEPVPKPVKLPKNWRTATDSEGNVYYYHSITRQTQWDPPSENEEESEDEEEDSSSEESESSDTPTYDEPKVKSSKHSRKKSKKRKPTKAAADTSVVPVRPEIAKKIKELFRTKISSFIVHCLNVYRKPSCSVGRITSNEDFKYLARKLTHYTMTKELKQCKNVEDLDCNETVMHKAKDFIKKYMAKYGSHYSRKEKNSPQ